MPDADNSAPDFPRACARSGRVSRRRQISTIDALLLYAFTLRFTYALRFGGLRVYVTFRLSIETVM
jgi:hypothetical protein